MTLRYFNGTLIETNPGLDAIFAFDGDYVIIDRNGVYGAIGDDAGSDLADGIDVSSLAVSVQVTVAGTLFGRNSGINFNGLTGPSSITVTSTGQVMSETGPTLDLWGTLAAVTNHGFIQSARATSTIWSGATITNIVNSGTIQANSGFAINTDSLIRTSISNTGLIAAADSGASAIYMNGVGADVIWNAGTIIGNIFTGQGNDYFYGTGQVTGEILTGGGNDTVAGGGFDDRIGDGAGGNWLAGGDGADRITIGNTALDGRIDHVFGGVMGGADTSTNDTILFSVEGTFTGVNVYLGAGYATAVGSNALIAVMTGIENAVGTDYNDSLIGSAAGNVLIGGYGADWMVGNGGADVFRFNFHHDAAGDQVRDLRRSEGDRIDLSGVDANIANPGDDAFVFRTTHTTDAAGELVVTNFGVGARVDLYVDADNVVDGFFFVVYGEAGMGSLQAGDFLL